MDPPQSPTPDADLSTILSDMQRTLLPSLGTYFSRRGFVLCGGTALAIYLGHRRSRDFDFMADKPFSADDLVADLAYLQLRSEVLREGAHSVTQVLLNVRGIRVEVTRARLSTDDAVMAYGTVLIPSFKELACMKAAAAIRRGAKRDIADLYFMTRKHVTPRELVHMVCVRYRERTHYAFTPETVIKRIVNFEEGLVFDGDDPLDLVAPVPWELIAETIKHEFGALDPQEY
jgi:predicted nucleotidyltransferase component of viral defense system